MDHDWFYVNWQVDFRGEYFQLSQENKELLAALLGLERWLPAVEGCTFELCTDNNGVREIFRALWHDDIFPKTCPQALVDKLSHVRSLAHTRNVHLKVQLIRGEENETADSISRMHCMMCGEKVLHTFGHYKPGHTISPEANSYLAQRVAHLQGSDLQATFCYNHRFL